MTIEELIKEKCSNWVEWKDTWSICKISTGKLNANAMDEDWIYPFFTCDANPYRINEYAFDTSAILISWNGSQVWHLNKYDWKFNAYQRTYVLDKFEYITRDFMYCYMSAYLRDYIMKNCKKGAVPYITLPMLQSFKVPIPPLEVQNEIVKILDKFVEFEMELETELNLRIKQRDGFKQRLFNFIKDINWDSAENVCYIEKGKTPIQKAEPGEYPLVVTTSERKSCSNYQFDSPAVCIPLVSSRWHWVASLNHVYYQEGKFALGNILCAMIPKDVNKLSAKFLYQYLEYQKDILLVGLMKWWANVAMHKEDLQKIKLPIPSLREQERIVYELDTCDEIIDAITNELKLRVQRHKYYVDKIFSF